MWEKFKCIEVIIYSNSDCCSLDWNFKQNHSIYINININIILYLTQQNE